MKKIIIILIFVMCSCKTYLTTNYKITDKSNRNYYTDKYIIYNDSIVFQEVGRSWYRISMEGLIISNK